MKRALQEISDMATSLEASGMDQQQAGATLEAIANSIEKFAVTPERLREILEESQQTLYERIKAENNLRFDGIDQRIEGVTESVNQRFDAVDQRFDAVNQRFDDLTKNTNERFNDLRAEQRADSSRLFNLMLAIALGMAGIAGSWLYGQFF